MNGEGRPIQVEIRETVAVPGHYWAFPINIDNIGPGTTKRVDTRIPIPVEVVSGKAFLSAADDGDEIMAKSVVGKIASLAAGASEGATQVVLVSQTGVLRKTEDNGAIDVGFFLSFGNEDWQPATDLSEYMIVAISDPVDIGGGYETVTVTLDRGLEDDVAENTDVNLVVRFTHSPYRVLKGQYLAIGDNSTKGSHIPANTCVRFEYKNVGQSQKSVPAVLFVRY